MEKYEFIQRAVFKMNIAPSNLNTNKRLLQRVSVNVSVTKANVDKPHHPGDLEWSVPAHTAQKDTADSRLAA